MQPFAVNVAELVALALVIAVVVPSANVPLTPAAGSSTSLWELLRASRK
jgi:hypothetical protein